jgi:two-component system, cell cycle sensor histidine kinase and response regulator CckA
VFVVSVRDITVPKKVEETLRLAQFAFDKASFGIFRSGEDGNILDVNEQACKSLGYSNEELCRLSIFDIDPALSQDNLLELWRKMMAAEAVSFESVHRTKDGRTFPVHITSNRLTYGGM